MYSNREQYGKVTGGRGRKRGMGENKVTTPFLTEKIKKGLYTPITDIYRYIRNILPHMKHRWETRGYNRYYLPTDQICRVCGITREIFKGDGQLNFLWVYSDGTKEKDERVFRWKGTPPI